MKIYYFLIILLIQASIIYAKSNVIQLNSNNFNEQVMASDSNWFIKFYAPWCHYCKELAPEYEKLSEQNQLKEVNIGEVNCDTDQALCEKHNVEGLPTLKFFNANQKQSPIEYEGQRTVDDMYDFFYEVLEQNDQKEINKIKDEL